MEKKLSYSFHDIEEGRLPDDNYLLDLIQKPEKAELSDIPKIEKYRTILENGFENASTQERVLLAKVLFVLETWLDLNAPEKFTHRILRLNTSQINQSDIEFFTNIFETFEPETLIPILRDHIKKGSTLDGTELRSGFNWMLHKIWNIPTFYNHPIWKDLYDPLKSLIESLMKQDRVSETMYVEFFTYHFMGNNFHTIDEWREFNRNVTQKTAPFYQAHAKKLPPCNPKKKDKKRIAFVKDRIVFNSPFQVEYSLFKSLMEQKEFTDHYEIAVYTFNQFEKSHDDPKCIDMLESIGVKVINPVQSFQPYAFYNDHYKKALKMRETLLKDDIDIMIAGGVFPIVDFLYLSRTAPVQIYYSHGNCAFDIDGIDKRVSHFEQECKEFRWNIISVPMAKEFLVGTEGEKEVGLIIKEDYKRRFGEDVVILGTIGRLVKIDSDEYLKTIAKIMEQNPNTIYLACGGGNEDSIKDKIKKFGINEERFIFNGLIKPHVYGWVIDVWPDSFPLRQGQSKNEYLAKGGVVVFMEKYVNDTIKNWYKDLDIKVLAKDKDEYISIMESFIKNPNKREQVQRFNTKIFENIHTDLLKIL